MAVGFHEVQFPADISAGATGGPEFHTTILTLASGFEQRNIDWSKARATYDISHAARTDEQIAALINFFHARAGMAYGFRFKDWNDFRAPFWKDQPGDIVPVPDLFITDGATSSFVLTKAYGDVGATYTRTINKPVAGSVALFNGVTQLIVPTDYTIDTATGIITLSAALRTSSGTHIKGYFEFDVPCRFNSDSLQATITKRGLADFNNLAVIEVRLT